MKIVGPQQVQILMMSREGIDGRTRLAPTGVPAPASVQNVLIEPLAERIITATDQIYPDFTG